MKRFSRRRRGPNFWGDWEDEWRRRNAPPTPPQPPRPPEPPEQVEAWRDFFLKFTGALPEQHWAFGGRRFHPWHHGDVSFNPFVANLFSQGGGLLPLIVLHLLKDAPRYGNELMTLISERTAGQWTANPGAIYPLMNELETRGLVEGAWDDPRKRTVRIYHLTEKGRREMDRVKAVVLPKLDEAVEVLQSIANDLSSPRDATTDESEDQGEAVDE